MKKNQVIVITTGDSPYFQSAVLVLRENMVCEEDKLLNEANAIVSRLARRCGEGRLAPHRRGIADASATVAVFAAVFALVCVAAIILI